MIQLSDRTVFSGITIANYICNSGLFLFDQDLLPLNLTLFLLNCFRFFICEVESDGFGLIQSQYLFQVIILDDVLLFIHTELVFLLELLFSNSEHVFDCSFVYFYSQGLFLLAIVQLNQPGLSLFYHSN
jgi:hypothetical protein